MTKLKLTKHKLNGMCVVITRPAHQAKGLSDLIEAHGGRPVQFPVLEIADPPDKRALFHLIDRLDRFAIAIFISANAVNKGVKLIRERRDFPSGLKVAALGKVTAKALQYLGIKTDILPGPRFDSEALLAQEGLLHVSGERIVIFRGVGGRELLAQTLRARGAQVEYAECYRRIKPPSDASRLLRYWQAGGIDAIIVTSKEGLHNLCEMVGIEGRNSLLKSQLVVISERLASCVRELGFIHNPLVAANASDQALLEALSRCHPAPSDDPSG